MTTLTNTELNEAIRTAQDYLSGRNYVSQEFISHINALRAEQLRRATEKNSDVAIAKAFKQCAYHVEVRTNACADICDEEGAVVATFALGNPIQRARAICDAINAVTT